MSTLKGEGELCNLDLNEQVLTDLLELPNWLKITRAHVNKLTIKIQWTKLKSVPILLVCFHYIYQSFGWIFVCKPKMKKN